MKKFIIVAGAAVMLILVLTGCGSTSSASEPSTQAPPTKQAPPRHPVAQELAASLGATNATCVREGWMVFVGERETVYGCTTGAGVSRSERCYVYIDGIAEDVTDRLVDDDEAWPCTSELRAEAARKAAAARAAKARRLAAFNKGWSSCSKTKYKGSGFEAWLRNPAIDRNARARGIAGMLADQFNAPAENRGRWLKGCIAAVF